MTYERTIYVVVEGASEERFVKDVLCPHFLDNVSGVNVIPIIVETGRKGCRKLKGGVSSFEKISKDVSKVCKEHGSAVVTTMFDLYAFPKDIAGKEWTKGHTVEDVESMMRDAIGFENFIPFLMKHELETLLFSDVGYFGDYPKVMRDLESILAKHNDDPESINTTHSPSHRIDETFRKYGGIFSKLTIGSPIYPQIGLYKMRCKCPHFDGWISKLESKFK